MLTRDAVLGKLVVDSEGFDCSSLRIFLSFGCGEGEPNVMEGAEDLAVAMAAVGAIDSDVDSDVDAELGNANPGTPEALSVLSVLVDVPNVEDWKEKPPEEVGLLFSFSPVVAAFVLAVPKPNDPKEDEDDVALAADACFGAEGATNVKPLDPIEPVTPLDSFFGCVCPAWFPSLVSFDFSAFSGVLSLGKRSASQERHWDADSGFREKHVEHFHPLEFACKKAVSHVDVVGFSVLRAPHCRHSDSSLGFMAPHFEHFHSSDSLARDFLGSFVSPVDSPTSDLSPFVTSSSSVDVIKSESESVGLSPHRW